MIEASPKIPTESRIHRLPVFHSHPSLLRLTSSSSAISVPTQASSYDLERPVVRRCYTEATIVLKCMCPHVMVADDDPFQAVYYKTLFQRSLSYTDLPVKKETLRLKVFSSGEELIEAFHQHQACGCRSVKLIITDHDMGEKKLNGVETIQQLAKTKHQNPVLLRTSNTLEELSKTQKSLPGLLGSKVITQFLDKSDYVKTRATIENLLREEQR